MNKRYYFGINGIMNDPSSLYGCTDVWEDWIEENTEFQAGKFEYQCGPLLTKDLYQNARVENVRIKLNRISSDLYMIGHSNGCDIIQRYVGSSARKIKELHLVAAASEADFRKNGYNAALKENRVDYIHVYYSKNDKTLEGRFNSKLNSLLRKVGMGYGTLGYTGPKYIDPLYRDRVILHEWDCKHSEYYNADNLTKLMNTIVQ